jgi:hypothetical protein
MIEDQKVKSKEVIPVREEYQPRSLWSYFNEDN